MGIFEKLHPIPHLKISIGILLIISVLGFRLVNSGGIEQTRFEAIVVLELFTSQGCSSCPSADRLLDQVREKHADKGVITLSYHVAYWNYIGWKDPFSKKEHADKQRIYAKKFGEGRIYTPQLVVNGIEHFVGSDSQKLMRAVEHYGRINTLNSFEAKILESGANTINFEYKLLGPEHGRTVRAALVLEERETYIERGENSRRTLKNTNVVIAEKSLNLNSSSARLSIPNSVKKGDKLRLILIAENGRQDIVGASQIHI